MLRACRAVLRRGGRLAFFTIEPAAGLAPAERRRAARVGPSAVAVRTSYPQLLASAGFSDIEHRDRTAEYRATQQAWIDATERHADAVRAIMGGPALAQRLADRRRTLGAIDAGVLVRRSYVAVHGEQARTGPGR